MNPSVAPCWKDYIFRQHRNPVVGVRLFPCRLSCPVVAWSLVPVLVFLRKVDGPDGAEIPLILVSLEQDLGYIRPLLVADSELVKAGGGDPPHQRLPARASRRLQHIPERPRLVRVHLV